MGVLAIAQGAAKIAGKLFQGVKKARDKKVQKAAQRLVNAQEKQSSIGQFFNPGIVQTADLGKVARPGLISSLGSLISGEGSQQISSAANNLNAVKGGPVEPRTGSEAATSGGTGMGIDPKIILYGLGALLLFFIIKRK